MNLQLILELYIYYLYTHNMYVVCFRYFKLPLKNVNHKSSIGIGCSCNAQSYQLTKGGNVLLGPGSAIRLCVAAWGRFVFLNVTTLQIQRFSWDLCPKLDVKPCFVSMCRSFAWKPYGIQNIKSWTTVAGCDLLQDFGLSTLREGSVAGSVPKGKCSESSAGKHRSRDKRRVQVSTTENCRWFSLCPKVDLHAYIYLYIYIYIYQYIQAYTW